MARLVAVSGAQGAGKTTVLTMMKARGWVVDDFKASRQVQADLGMSSLQDVMSSVPTMLKFQNAVLEVKKQREEYLASLAGDIILTERSFADIAAYTTHWCWQHVDDKNWDFFTASRWLTPYIAECAEAQQVYSGVILVPMMPVIKWEDDPQRADRWSVDSIFEDITSFVQRTQPDINRRLLISTQMVEDRVAQIEKFLEAL